MRGKVEAARLLTHFRALLGSPELEDQHDLSDTRFEPTKLKVRRLTALISIVTHRAQVQGPQQEKVTAHSAG